MHDEVWGCVETLEDFFFNQRMLFNDFVTETVRCQYVLTFTRESKHEHKNLQGTNHRNKGTT